MTKKKSSGKLTKEEQASYDKELAGYYQYCLEKINELTDYFKAFILYTKHLTDEFDGLGKSGAKFRNMNVHKPYSEYYQMYEVLMAEYDFRILYDSQSPLLFHRFPYHQVRDEYTPYEFIENDVSYEEVFRKVSPATENLC